MSAGSPSRSNIDREIFPALFGTASPQSVDAHWKACHRVIFQGSDVGVGRQAVARLYRYFIRETAESPFTLYDHDFIGELLSTQLA